MTEIMDILALQDFVLTRFIVSLLLAIMLGLSVAYTYKVTHKGLNYESSFLSTLALLAPIVTLVMFFIQGDLVLSLGLVGSLSIIRFRTPIKDTRDMVFLFWTIATGLGVGTMNWTLTIVSTLILGTVLFIFYKVSYGKNVHNEYILMVSGEQYFDDSLIKEWEEKGLMSMHLRSREIQDSVFDVVYELRFDEANMDHVHAFIDALQKQTHITRVSLLAPQLNLPM